MSAAALQDLLEWLREHPAFPELLKLIESNAAIKPYRPDTTDEAAQQQADWIFRSGRQYQTQVVKELLTKYQPLKNEDEHARRQQSATRG